MISAVAASVCFNSSLRASSISLMSVSMSGGKVAVILRVLRSALVDELREQRALNRIQRLEHAGAVVGRCRKRGDLHVAAVEQELHIFDRSRSRQITLVILQDVRRSEERRVGKECRS